MRCHTQHSLCLTAVPGFPQRNSRELSSASTGVQRSVWMSARIDRQDRPPLRRNDCDRIVPFSLCALRVAVCPTEQTCLVPVRMLRFPELVGCACFSRPAGSFHVRNLADAFQKLLRPLAAARQSHCDGADGTLPVDAGEHSRCTGGHVLRPSRCAAYAAVSPFKLEFVMTLKNQRPASTPVTVRPPSPTPPNPTIPPTLPAEPSEVLGRHKNSGQKDHKGAR